MPNPQLQLPFLNTPLSQVISLDAGMVAVLVNAILAAGSGTALSQVFTVPEKFGSSGATLTLTAIPAGAVTAVTVDIEVSPDGGTTWAKKKVGLALITASVNTQGVEANLQAGMLYRINPTTVTAGTSVTITGTAS